MKYVELKVRTCACVRARIIFGGLLRKLQLADINLAVTYIATPSPGGGADYWRCDKKSANPPNIIPHQYFRLYGIYNPIVVHRISLHCSKYS